MIQLAVLPLALALGAATPAEGPAVEQVSVQTVQDEGGQASATAEEPGFFEKFYPFGFAENLEPEVEENFVLLYILGSGVVFLSNIWAPIVFVGNAGDMVIDQLISTVVHWVPMIIPIVNCIMIPATIFYLLPVATINITDRNVKLAKKNGTWKAASNTVRPPNEQELALAEPSMAF